MKKISRIRRTELFLLGILLLFVATMLSFRIQAYLFDREVRSVLSQMKQFQLERTSEETVLEALPRMRRGTPGVPMYAVVDQVRYACPADACYALHTGNVPTGWLVRLKYKLGPSFDWLYRLVYRLGHRFCAFDSWVQIRGGNVANFGYSLIVEDANAAGNDLVGVEVTGTNRTSFSRGQGFNLSYEEINGFHVRVASNKPTTSLFVAFTPEGRPEDIRKAFAVNLRCMWNFEGCSAARQILPGVSK